MLTSTWDLAPWDMRLVSLPPCCPVIGNLQSRHGVWGTEKADPADVARGTASDERCEELVDDAAAKIQRPIDLLSIQPDNRQQTFEGWGTSLCWFANVMGAQLD